MKLILFVLLKYYAKKVNANGKLLHINGKK